MYMHDLCRQRDIGVSVTHLLYPRLSLILKSVICLSRTTPAYRLSRQQEDNIKFTYVSIMDMYLKYNNWTCRVT